MAIILMTTITAAFLEIPLTIFLIFLLKPFAHATNLIDWPRARRIHDLPTPMTGGLAICLTLLLLTPFVKEPLGDFSTMGILLAIMLLVGLVDDYTEMSAWQSACLQGLVGYLLVSICHVRVEHLGNLLGWGDIHTAYLATGVTIVSLLGVINAINMLDGADGVAGGVMCVAAAWFAVLSWLSGSQATYGVAILLIGALGGFLWLNMRTPLLPRAQVFMGSAGTMVLGLVITWLAITLSTKSTNSIPPIICVWVIGLPLADMARVMVRRLRQRKSMFDGDQIHLHHYLMGLGYTPGIVALIIIVVSFLLGAVAVIAWVLGVPEWLMFLAFMAGLGLYIKYLDSSHPASPKI